MAGVGIELVCARWLVEDGGIQHNSLLRYQAHDLCVTMVYDYKCC
jgi:hypothetical protein